MGSMSRSGHAHLSRVASPWILSLLVAGCTPTTPPPDADAVRGTQVGDPIPGLSPTELARFEAGKVAFSRIFLPEEGLGPVYNENTCNACHSHPVTGGSGGEEYDVKATHQVDDGSCDLLPSHGGGNIRSQVTPVAAAHGVIPERVPAEANQKGFFTAPPLWGRGLIEAVSDETLLAMADPEDVDGDGIAGRVGRDPQGRIARFLRKAFVSDLSDAAEGSVLVEMGLTTASHPEERVFSVTTLPEGADPAPDPELDDGTIAAIADFIRFLALPPRNMPADPEEQARVAAGEALFHEVGCARCHVPFLVTGPNPVAALDQKPVPLYSDLLLHDMGPERRSICAPAASATEFRTEPLTGLGMRTVYMHDGLAPGLWEAIALHGGTAAPSREAFQALTELQRHALIAFLFTL